MCAPVECSFEEVQWDFFPALHKAFFSNFNELSWGVQLREYRNLGLADVAALFVPVSPLVCIVFSILGTALLFYLLVLLGLTFLLCPHPLFKSMFVSYLAPMVRCATKSLTQNTPGRDMNHGAEKEWPRKKVLAK